MGPAVLLARKAAQTGDTASSRDGADGIGRGGEEILTLLQKARSTNGLAGSVIPEITERQQRGPNRA